jgi:hypothetical protein
MGHNPRDRPPSKRWFQLLEWLAGGVLLSVVIALGWATVAAYRPTWLRLLSLEIEVLVVLGLLVAALFLISVVALLHTKD